MAALQSDLDVLRLYSKASFRGAAFNYVQMRSTLSHDQAEHKYPGKAGALVEGMGRNPQLFTFKVVFRRGLGGSDPAQHFPNDWRAFVTACEDPSTGPLVHPEYGTVKVKCKKVDTDWMADRRDGCDVDVEFVETLDTADEEALLFTDKSPGADASAAARDYEKEIADVDYDPGTPDAVAPDLLTSLKALDGLLAQASLGVNNISAQFDAYLGAVDTLIQDLNAQDNPKLQAAISALQKLYGSVIKMAENALSISGKPITQKVVENGGPINIVAGSFGMSCGDFCKLNPAIADKSSVNSGTMVFVYDK